MTELLGTIEGFAERRGVGADLTDKKALTSLEDASAFIRCYTHQDFDAVADDEITRDGTGRYGLLLPQLPVTAVTEVSEIDDGGTATTLEVTDYRVDAYGMLWRLDGDVWCYGHANVTVTYDHGGPIPPDIAAACYDLAAENYISTGGGSVTSEQIGNYQVTYDAATVGGAELPDSIKYTLDKYRVKQ